MNKSNMSQETQVVSKESNNYDEITMNKDIITTTFVDDAGLNIVKPLNQLSLSQRFLETSDNTKEQTILEFLAKPLVIQSGVLQVGDTVSTFTPLDVPISTNVLITNKLKGYAGIRCDLHFKIVINANRFQMGRYMLTFVPFGVGRGVTNNADAWYNMHTAHIAIRTQLKRCEFDLNCDTSAELEIPFMCENLYLSITDLGVAQSFGRIRIFPYVPLATTAGTTTVPYTIYQSLTNVKLFGAASAQGFDDEEIPEKDKPISKGLKVISRGLQEIGKNQLLTDFVRPLAWVTGISSNLASVFGFSKPSTVGTTTYVLRDHSPNFAHVDGIDKSKKLAMYLDNSVDALPGFAGSNADEMGINYIASIPAHYLTFTWGVGQGVGTDLFAEQVRPNANIKNIVIPGVYTANAYTPLQFVSTLFKYWRGSIIYTFKVVKTEFHSGRLNIAFYPNDGMFNNNLLQTHASSPFVHRMIVDIRKHNMFEVTIPYISPEPYRLNEGSGTMGHIHVFVEDLLVAPATVPNTITLLVEHRAGPDFEVAFPVGGTLSPILDITPQSFDDDDCSLFKGTLGSSQPPINSLEPAKCSIGERLISFRAFLRRYTILKLIPTASATFTNIYPFANSYFVVGATIPTIPTTICDPYALFSSIYMFTRGSVRIKGVTAGANLGTVISTLEFATVNPSSTIVINANDAAGNSDANFRGTPQTQTFNWSQNTSWEVEAPMYSLNVSRNNQQHMLGGNVLYGNVYVYDVINSNSTATRLAVSLSGTSGNHTEQSRFARAMGDDGNMGGFVSIPPLAPGFIKVQPT